MTTKILQSLIKNNTNKAAYLVQSHNIIFITNFLLYASGAWIS